VKVLVKFAVARLGHCLLLLLQAEMTAPTVRSSRGRKKQVRRSQG
jgi:hypothetical protein